MNIREQIEILLKYKNISKVELARRLDIYPQSLCSRLNSKYFNLQFLISVAKVTDSSFYIYVKDNKSDLEITNTTQEQIEKTMNIKELINILLKYKHISKVELARRLDTLPQLLNAKLNSKRLNLQFLTSVAKVTDSSFYIYFKDNINNQKITDNIQEQISKTKIKYQIEILLKYKNITKPELARRLGISRQAIHDRLNSKSLNLYPDLQFLTSITKATDCSLNFYIKDNNIDSEITEITDATQEQIEKTMNIREQIEILLAYKNITKPELARRLDILPQLLNTKLNSKKLNLQFLTSVAKATDSSFYIYFKDNINNQKIIENKITDVNTNSEKGINSEIY